MNRFKPYVISFLAVFAFIAFNIARADEADHSEETSVFGSIFGTINNIGIHINEAEPGTNLSDTPEEELYPQPKESPGVGVFALIPDLFGALVEGNLSGLLLKIILYFEIPQPEWDLFNHPDTPQIPTINRTVVGITEQGGFTHPHIPPLRWSADGRLGVNSQVGGFTNDPYPVLLYLLQPEALEKPFLESSPGPQTLALDVKELPFRKLSPEHGALIQHTNICDPFYSDPNAKKNPYACGINNQDDCYDVVLISALTTGGVDVPPGGTFPAQLAEWDRVMSTPLHIRVSNPKTPQAKIETVEYGESQYAPKRTGVLFETTTPADGRLLVARRAFMPLLWQNEAQNKAQIGSYDIVYAVAPPDAEPCDVTHWGDMYPISHAPYDERVNQRYLFAKQPFRDPTGEIIPDGADIKGTYPWIDKEAKMLSFQTAAATLFPRYHYSRDPASRYPVRCVADECSADSMSDTDISKDNLFVIMGAWTQGKMVLLDGLLNDVDYRLGLLDKSQSYLSLYQADNNRENGGGDVRVGATRIKTTEPIDVPVFDINNNIKGLYRPRNTSMFDSVENRFNYLENFQRAKPDDVVWIMSSGHSTVEFAFDDYLKPDAFIISNMVGLMKWRNNHFYKMTYYDGWNPLLQSFTSQVRVQNSATATNAQWQVPEYGRVHGGRLEPVANGGVRGKGMWFNGYSTRIDYSVPKQEKNIRDQSWYYALFIDPRDSESDVDSTLIKFPNQSELALKGISHLLLVDAGNIELASIDLKGILADQSWTQLGILVEHGNSTEQTTIDIYLNGYPYHRWRGHSSNGFFLPSEGTLSLGGGSHHAMNFKGWMDEFKIFAHQPDFESICNLAHGTLAGVSETLSSNSYWQKFASLYSTKMHNRITQSLELYGKPSYAQYVCYHDYSDDNQAHLKNIPSDLIGIKNDLQFPEGPLYHNAPRPDSSANPFCLSCHHASGVGGLNLEALDYAPIEAKLDPRRQPAQPPARVFGAIPGQWLPGSPESSQDAGFEGQSVDEWILPSAEDQTPQIHHMVLVTDNGVPYRRISDEETLSPEQMHKYHLGLRLMTNGLTNRVQLEVNNIPLELNTPPFLISLDLLHSGENHLRARGLDSLNQLSEVYTVRFNVE